MDEPVALCEICPAITSAELEEWRAVLDARRVIQVARSGAEDPEGRYRLHGATQRMDSRLGKLFQMANYLYIH
jgi:hypothetical protein